MVFVLLVLGFGFLKGSIPMGNIKRLGFWIVDGIEGMIVGIWVAWGYFLVISSRESLKRLFWGFYRTILDGVGGDDKVVQVKMVASG